MSDGDNVITVDFGKRLRCPCGWAVPKCISVEGVFVGDIDVTFICPLCEAVLRLGRKKEDGLFHLHFVMGPCSSSLMSHPFPLRIYLASSWRNEQQPVVLSALRAEGFHVYDFRNPGPGDHGFSWSEIDPKWQSWTPHEFRAALETRIARGGFFTDMRALEACDVCVLLQPAGRSAALELGYAAGQKKKTIALLSPEKFEPELMLRMADRITVTVEETIDVLLEWQKRR